MMSHTDTRLQALWQQALEEDSNRALDWLWLYTQVETDEQREFCLRKVRYINGEKGATRPGDELLAYAARPVTKGGSVSSC